MNRMRKSSVIHPSERSCRTDKLDRGSAAYAVLPQFFAYSASFLASAMIF